MAVTIKKMSKEELEKTTHYYSSYSNGDWVFVNNDLKQANYYGYFYNTKTGAIIQKTAKGDESYHYAFDGIKSNNPTREGNTSSAQKKLNEMFLYKLNTGKEFENYEEAQSLGINLTNKKQYENFIKDIDSIFSHHGIETASENISLGLFSGEGGKNYESFKTYLEGLDLIDGDRNLTPEEKERALKDLNDKISKGKEPTEEKLSPYTRYMEKMQKDQESAEFGLLQAQTRMAQEQADIAAQQAMMQQSQFKDQLIEQIKSDRLGKMRQGISPMQIANEELQMMVGGMQQNTQMMSQVNQQQLGAAQQQRLNPYQAYINSQQAVTGGQGYANFAAGLDATRASSMSDQIAILRNQNPTWTDSQILNAISGRHIDENPQNKPIKN